MLEKLFETLKSEDRTLPNKFTIALGKRIRDARLEAGLSQAELAEKAYFKQSSISKIESGNKSITAEDILYFSYALEKPLSYFFPKEFRDDTFEELSDDEQEFLMLVRKMDRRELKQLMSIANTLIKD